MQCRSCGTVLQPEVVACPACGTPVASSDNSDFSLYDSSDETIPYIPYAPPVEISSALSSQQLKLGTQPYTDPQLYMGPQPVPASNIQPLPGAIQLPLTVSQQRGGFSAPMRVLLIFLVLLIVAGGGLIYYTLAIRPAQRQNQVIPTTGVISATQPLTNAQNTPITTTNPQELYVQATSGTPALDDSVNAQNSNDWQALGNNSCTFEGTTLHVTSSNKDAACVATSTNFNNFAYQAQVTITQGDISGLAFRVDAIDAALYLFAIDSNGTYVLGAGQVGSLGQGNFKLLAGATSSAINTGLGQPDLLTVIVRGNTIYLYVNKQFLTSISDSTASFGSIGVWAENTQNGPVAAAFSAIQVWTL